MRRISRTRCRLKCSRPFRWPISATLKLERLVGRRRRERHRQGAGRTGRAQHVIRARGGARRRRGRYAQSSTSPARSTVRPSRAASAEGANLVIGKKQFIPGFEEALIGAKAGDERLIKATFPDDYPMPTLAGKAAEFDVKVKTVSGRSKPEIDDAFAVGLGAESLDNLKDLVEGPDPARARRRRAHEAEARTARRTRSRAHVRAAAVARRFRVHQHLDAGREQPQGHEQDVRGRGQDRRRGARRISQDRRAPRAPRSGGRRDRREEQDCVTQDEMRRALDRAGAPLSRPGEDGLRILREDAGRACRAARADFRGQGHRLHIVERRKAGGEEGVEGRAC